MIRILYYSVASTWREAIDNARFGQHSFCFSKIIEGKFVSIRDERGCTTVNHLLASLETETGCKAMIMLAGSQCGMFFQFLQLNLLGVGFPENEDWANKGEAPWSDGGWGETKRL